WCVRASGRNLPATELDGLQVVGARMDRVGSTDIVTVTYAVSSGQRVTVGWLEGQVPSGSGIEDTDRSGHRLLIVHARAGSSVASFAASRSTTRGLGCPSGPPAMATRRPNMPR